MLRGRALLRRTPFRIALTFTVLVLAAFVVSGAVVYRIMDAELSDRVDEGLKQTFSVVSEAFGDDDLEDLIAAVDSQVANSDDGQRLFSLNAPDRRRLAGNFDGSNLLDGFSQADGRRLGLDDADYRLFQGKVGPYTLAVGLSRQDADELNAVVLGGFAWATLIVTLLAVSLGALLAARVDRRLDAIAAAMADISRGKLDARIPLLGNGDDIDDVSLEVNKALDRLSSLVESMRQVSSDIAHDLKTPLNRLQISLLGAAEKASGTGIADDLDDAQKEITRINETFDALLRIAQIEAGARKARFGPVHISSILEDIAEIYGDVAADAGRKLELAAPRTLPQIKGDRELLTQMVANLVENAIRHCPVGTFISINGRTTPDAVEIIVEDNGPGIPAEEREKVFRRLYRMEKSRTTPGSGLGLNLVRAVAELHEAKVLLSDAAPGLRVIVQFQRT